MSWAKQVIQSILRRSGYELTRYKENPYERVLFLNTSNKNLPRALLSYVIDPFLLKPGEPVSNQHTHDWESLQIADTLIDFGYQVDVIDYRNFSFQPIKKYALFIGARTNFERIAKRINDDCLKIVHLDTAHWVFNNLAAYQRIAAIKKGKNTAIRNPKFIEINHAVEHADCCTLLGNQFTEETYIYAQKPLYRIPISTCALYQRPVKKDWSACRKNFLWFGSGGLAHKGLDLTLEAFAEMPDHHLYVCGPVKNEKDFEQAFYRELYQTPNIRTMGWVDVNGPEFIKIINNCVALVYPSCSEGQSGSVVNCMHAGLIPIISYESGVDMKDFGLILQKTSVEEIKKAVGRIAGLSSEALKQMALNTWEFARANHTRDKFKKVFRQTLSTILGNEQTGMLK